MRNGARCYRNDRQISIPKRMRQTSRSHATIGRDKNQWNNHNKIGRYYEHFAE